VDANERAALVSPVPWIVRSADPPEIDAVQVSTTEALERTLTSHWPMHRWLVSDLSLGAWQSHQVASELLAQLGETASDERPDEAARADPPHPSPSYADVVGAGIDGEGFGDATMVRVLAGVARVVRALETGPLRLIVIIAPRFDGIWAEENLRFVQVLSQAFRCGPSGLALVTVEGTPLSLPDGWRIRWRESAPGRPGVGRVGLADLVPGTLSPDVGKALALTHPDGAPSLDGVSLEHGYTLRPLEGRRPPSEVSRLEFDRLAMTVRPWGWLDAYAQCYGNTLYVRPTSLAQQAWRHFGDGCPELALRLLGRARTAARTPSDQGTVDAQAQGIRIAHHQFHEVTAVPDPSPAIPPSLRGFLLQAKGWGLAMSDDPGQADPYLRDARHLMAVEPGSREALYLQNIHALVRLKCKDWEGALSLEQAIEAQEARLPERDWRLHYVNAINLSRLHRRRGQFDEADAYAERAFATTLGVRSESDALYANVTRAQLDAERGRPVDAFRAWVRAALHWAASAVPEAISGRVGHAIVRRPIARNELPAMISEALITALREAARFAGLANSRPVSKTADAKRRPAPVFVRADQCPPEWLGGIPWIGGAAGWSLLALSGVGPAPFAEPRHEELRTLLVELLAPLCPALPLADTDAFLVDDRHGREMGTTPLECLETAVRLGIPTIGFGNGLMRLASGLSEELQFTSRVRVGPAVHRLERLDDTIRVVFKRYRRPWTASPPEREILEAVGDGPSVRTLAARLIGATSTVYVLDTLRQLERTRVVTLELPEGADVLARLVPGRILA
jgi:tetratricopeptide (TPR) repeat protein